MALKIACYKAIVTVMLLILLCSMFARLVPVAKADAIASLHVSGTNLYNAAGQQVVLRGVMGGDAYWQFGYSPSQDLINQMANAGCNLLHWEMLDWAELEPSNGSYSPTNLAELDNIASWCAANHMYFSFTWYGLSYGSIWGVKTIPNWCDVPDQYSAAGDYGDHALDFELNFYDQNNTAYSNARNAYASCLQFIVERYMSNPYFIIGFFKEPFNDNGNASSYLENQISENSTLSAEYASTCSWLYSQIMATGYTGVVEVDNPWCNYGLSSPPKVTGANFIWDCDLYVCSAWDTNLAGWESGIQTCMSQYSGKPIIMGEWGFLDSSGNESDHIPDWTTVESTLQSQVSYLNSENISGASWFNFNQLYGSGCDGPNWFQFTSSETTTILSIASQGAESAPSLTPTQTPLSPPISNNVTLSQYSPIDFFHQGKVDAQDFFYFINAYIQYQANGIYNPACDLNHDGKTDAKDFFLFINYYIQYCDTSSD